MIKIICALLVLFSGYSAHYSGLEPSVPGEPDGISSFSEGTEELMVATETESRTSFQKNFHRLKIPSHGFDSRSWLFRPSKHLAGENLQVIPSLSTTRIIYPFHSFL